MKIRSSILYRDMFIFFQNQFIKILILSFLASLINFSINYLIFPDSEKIHTLINCINQTKNISEKKIYYLSEIIPLKEQYILLQCSLSNILSLLFSNTFLIGNLLTMIHLLNTNKYSNLVSNIALSMYIIPKLFYNIFFIIFCIQFGTLFFIIPGILLIILLSLVPLISIQNNFGFIRSVNLSIKITIKYFSVLTPIILLWLIINLFFTFITIQIWFFSIKILTIFVEVLNNLFFSLLIIFLYRFYMFYTTIKIKNND